MPDVRPYAPTDGFLSLEGDIARPGDGGASTAVDGLRYGHVVHLTLLAS
jgi:hypothetical protein